MNEVIVEQITHPPFGHTVIYPEAPVFTPDSRRFILAELNPDRGRQFCLYDFDARELITLTGEKGATAPSVSPDGRWMYYLVEEGDRLVLKRISLETFSDERLLEAERRGRVYPLSTISADGRRLVTAMRTGEREWSILRFDLDEPSVKIVFSHSEIPNAHPQYHRGGRYDLLIQENTGHRMDERGKFVRLTDELGATMFIIGDDGSNLRRLKIGRDGKVRVQGHQCWLGVSDEVIATLSTKSGHPVVRIKAGDPEYRLISDKAHFWHVHSSLDGRWFVCDIIGSGEIVVGSVETGEHRMICRSEASCGASQHTHPHPAISPDRRKVIFNSDKTGIPQVYVAFLPEGFEV
ncbi:PD40 domain-containing protein [Candidatus Poribacteria bacterium]|nr:PD40 domain-containing protein [Candidatus Poribacteria bacterium]